jgi:hypothetical protein
VNEWMPSKKKYNQRCNYNSDQRDNANGSPAHLVVRLGTGVIIAERLPVVILA